MGDRRDIERKIQALQLQYADQLPQRVDEIYTLWRELKSGDSSVLPHLIRQVHRLGGSGATFGFPAITDLARQLETQLEGQIGNEVALPVSRIDALLDALNHQLPAGPGF